MILIIIHIILILVNINIILIIIHIILIIILKHISLNELALSALTILFNIFKNRTILALR